MSLTESIVEDAALEWFGELGYAVGHGPQMAPGEPAAERDSFGEVVLVGWLREAIRRLNPAIPDEAREEALRKVLRIATPSLVQTNRAFHKMLRDGIPVEFIQPEPSPRPSSTGRGRSEAEGEGQRRWDIVRLIDFPDVRANDWLAVNQFTVIESGGSSPTGRGGGEGIGAHRRPDIVVFINGLPLGLIELKNAADEDATIWSAYAQLQTYKAEVPSLLAYNAALVVSDGLQGDPTFDTAQAIAVMLEKHGIACDMMHGFHWDKWTSGTPAERLQLIPAGQEHILEQEDGKKRWMQVVTELSRAFALCAASDEATAIRDDVSFFQALQAALNTQSSSHRKTPEQIDAVIRQLVSKAITTEGQVIDVFIAAGLPKPDISILSDGFLAEVRGLKYKNVAAELLEKLLKDELKVRAKRNLVQSQVFSEKLKKTLNAYHNRAISAMEVIEELIRLAKDLDAATKRGAAVVILLTLSSLGDGPGRSGTDLLPV